MFYLSRALLRPAAASWTSTLRLPKSSFPPAVNAADIDRYLPRCTDDLYAWQWRHRPADGTFTLHDGPPYANGSLHIGHALNKILKDIILRVQLTQGKRVRYVPGWDCHGLPIELKALEKARGTGSDALEKMDPMAVRQAARNLASEAIEHQRQSLKQWATMADWDSAWKTMDTEFELRQMEVFHRMLKKGLIYRRFKPVYWSPYSATALAEAELEYRDDHVSRSAFIRFPLLNIPSSLADRPGVDATQLGALVWTTTPWTLPANQAIAVHSDLAYAVVQTSDFGQLLIAESRLGSCRNHFQLNVIAHNIPGKDLIGKIQYRNALRGDDSPALPILHADFVSADAGTGLVHCAPGHGMEDYDLCLKHGITAFAPVDDRGHFTDLAAPARPELLSGMFTLGEGGKKVLEMLGGYGHVVATYQHRHRYPYDWRTKRPVIIRATEQWFANVGDIKKDALDALDTVDFVPASGKARLRSFVKGRSEWCISRQRAWGVPIPALYHRETGQALLDEDSVGHIMRVLKERGTDGWWTDSEFEGAWIPPALGDASMAKLYRRGKDTMDVWFDSGTSWTQCAPQDLPAPADMYLEGSDQHRGWFQSSLLTYVAHQKTGSAKIAPFKTLVTHGFTLDSKGRKMSKSIGNVISPDEIMTGTLAPPPKKIKKKGDTAAKTSPQRRPSYGPDALRLWVASSDYTKDITIGSEVLREVTTVLRKLRGITKLLLGALDDFDPAHLVRYEDLTHLDRMALLHLTKVNEYTRDRFEFHDFSKALGAIHNWTKVEVSAFYIEVTKDRLYLDQADGLSRRSVQTVMYHMYNYLLCMLAPLTPMLVEEAWEHTPEALKRDAIHPLRRLYPTAPELWRNESLEAVLPLFLRAKEAVNAAQERLRLDKQIGSSLESVITLSFPASTSELYTVFQAYEPELEALFVTSKLTLVLESEGQEQPTTTDGPIDCVASAPFGLDSRVEAAVHAHSVKYMQPPKSKCARCWRHAAPADVEEDQALCGRCMRVVEQWHA